MKVRVYCCNAVCPFKDCKNHLANLKLPKQFHIDRVNVSSMDATCEKYLTWVLQTLKEESGDKWNYKKPCSY